MIKKNIFYISIKLFVIYLLCFSEIFFQKKALPTSISQGPTSEYIRKIPDNRFYILGIGDKIRIQVAEDAEALEKVVTIDGQGTVFLERLKKIYIKGLTIEELTNILNKEYSKYVLNPDVLITIMSYRPVKVYVSGEVENPGIHVLSGSSSPLDTIEVFQSNLNPKNQTQSGTDLSIKDNVYFPSLIDFLRKSGGITVNADLLNIKITRKNSISNGGGRITTNVNLLETIELRDLSQNIRIFDGDTILIGKNPTPLVAQISKAIKSNINPKFIQVVVGGRVENPGTKKINKTGVLTDAIELAGGSKVIKGPLVFLRYNNDGSVDRRKFRYNSRSKRGSYKNPFLKNGDIVYIGKSNLNKANEVLSEIANPLKNIVQSYGFYKIITN